jgi:hypothetical protein
MGTPLSQIATRASACVLLLASSASPALAQETHHVQPVPYRPSQPVPVPAPASDDAASSSGPHHAGVLGSDTLILKSGGIMRGSIVELLPDDHATLLLPDGQSAIVAWSAILRVDRAPPADHAPAPPLPPALPTGTQPPAPPAALPGVQVHIETSSPVTLEHVSRDRNAAAPSDQCPSPCDRVLPLGDGYRIVGAGINATGWFQLRGEPGDRVVLTVARASKPAYYAGFAVAGAGVVAGLVGLSLIGAAKGPGRVFSASGRGEAMGVGVGLSIGSVVTIAAGLYLLATHSRSRTGQATLAPEHERPPEAPAPHEAMWREVPPVERAIPRPSEWTVLRSTF